MGDVFPLHDPEAIEMLQRGKRQREFFNTLSDEHAGNHVALYEQPDLSQIVLRFTSFEAYLWYVGVLPVEERGRVSPALYFPRVDKPGSYT